MPPVCPSSSRTPNLPIANFLHHVDDYESDVVLLAGRSRLPAAYLGKQLIRQLRRRAQLIFANNVFKPHVAEGIAIGIFRFRYTVGVEQEAVTRLDWHRENGVIIALLFHSEKQAITFDALQLAFAPAQ